MAVYCANLSSRCQDIYLKCRPKISCQSIRLLLRNFSPDQSDGSTGIAIQYESGSAATNCLYATNTFKRSLAKSLSKLSSANSDTSWHLIPLPTKDSICVFLMNEFVSTDPCIPRCVYQRLLWWYRGGRICNMMYTPDILAMFIPHFWDFLVMWTLYIQQKWLKSSLLHLTVLCRVCSTLTR